MQSLRCLSQKALQPAACCLFAGSLLPWLGPDKKAACSEQQGCSRLAGWLREKGGRWEDRLHIEQISGRGHGVVASGTIPAGQTLVEIPWALILSSKLAREDSDVKSMLRDLAWTDDCSDSSAIRLWLLRHAEDAQSPWRTWLSQLPQDAGAGASCLPIVLAQAGCNALRGTPLQRRADLLLQSVREEWAALEPLRARHPWLASYQRWLWCQAIVSTRSGTLPMEGTEKAVHCIIPVLDFLNHSAEPNACIVGNPTCAKLVSTEVIKAGQEVLISYGGHSAEQFLFAFGFLPEGSVADVAVPLALTEASARKRSELLGAGQVPCLRDENALEKLLGVLAEEPEFQGCSRWRLLEYLLALFKAWHRELAPPLFTFWRYPEAESLRCCYAAAVMRNLQAVQAELSSQPASGKEGLS